MKLLKRLFAKEVIAESELYDTPEKISVKVFYKILETNNLLLLEMPKAEIKQTWWLVRMIQYLWGLLTKKQEPEIKSHIEHLNEVWTGLLDFYYRNTNKQAWENFLRNFRNVVRIQNEITSCMAALEMIQLLDDRGYQHLKHFGIRSENIEAVKSAIMAKETKLELAENKLRKKDEGEAFKFYKILVSVKNAIKRDIDVEKTCLAEWVEILSGITEQNKAEHEALNKHKRR